MRACYRDTAVAFVRARTDTRAPIVRDRTRARGTTLAMGPAMRWMWIVLVATACGTRGGAATNPDTSLEASCQAIEADFEAALQDHGTCDTDADCTFVGGQLGLPTCDCAAAIGACGGNPIEKNAPGLARAQQDVTAFAAQCPREREICDCAPAGDLHCANHVCTANPYAYSCFPTPDAGP
jgi:hypothetical protein